VRITSLKIWDWDFWHPDELLGRGFIDIDALSFKPQEVSALNDITQRLGLGLLET
jgi:hypothetical protein